MGKVTIGGCCRPHALTLRGSYIAEPGALPQITSAVLDLGVNEADYTSRLKAQKGVWSDIRRAQRKGFMVREFAWSAHIPDIHAINHSMPERQGRPMAPQYRRGMDELGEHDPSARPPLQLCSQHWRKMAGVFSMEGRLVAYISLIRSDNLAMYSMILGHGDYLRFGIMHLIHWRLAQSLIDESVEMLLYGGWKDGGPGLRNWKRRLGFDPVNLVFE